MNEIIVQSSEPIRLDRYLRRYYPDATQGLIEKSLRLGKIKLNGAKSKTSVRVVQNDVITIFPGVFVVNEHTEIQEFPQDVIDLADQLLSQNILFSSEKFIAIDKPEGLAVQGGSKISLSIDEVLKYINYTQDTEYKLVHRLDKDTSGILLIANGYDNAAKLSNAFRDQLIKKVYIAILTGCPTSLEGNLVHKIGKDRSSVFEVVKELEIDGKLAETNYKVLKSNGGVSLVEFRPVTGRNHQLRFHSQFLGCPIVGDSKYGGDKHKRMLLHAKTITLPASVFGRKITIDSDLPYEFEI
ncbi:MAG: RluA family pseudouridine synthase [Rickettsiaceae bacterium]|nr:RluA family pseudouridine synthase [Rickettsiaceae bacterium]MDP4832768.1 RluA family pseudouridine synthase [Rickettsiaceae bacterium]MDP5020666.1 RluA family pseudouridine synthase [Rickettsiaceae bacterium]MDP5083636.1 RluA family pseudouridine synthase [Rickettsiaceae bacterium]